MSSALPDEPLMSETKCSGDSPLFPAAAVERYVLPAYSEALLKDLRTTHLFERVEEAEQLPEAPLVASVDRPVHGNAVIPLWTALSLGLIPTVTREAHGHVFWLAQRSCPGSTVQIDFRYSGNTILGWIAVPANLLPGRTAKPPPDHPEYRAALRTVICRRLSNSAATP